MTQGTDFPQSRHCQANMHQSNIIILKKLNENVEQNPVKKQ